MHKTGGNASIGLGVRREGVGVAKFMGAAGGLSIWAIMSLARVGTP